MKIIITKHFKERVDEYFGAWEEFDKFGYSDFAKEVLSSELEYTTKSGKVQRECSLLGTDFCVGFQWRGEALVATTLISPLDTAVCQKQARAFKAKSVKPFEV